MAGGNDHIFIENNDLLCAACDRPLETTLVDFHYLGHAFQAELPCCRRCGAVFIPEELARGRILHVEQSLEDK